MVRSGVPERVAMYLLVFAPVAQWIEQWIPNPCAASSILAGGTNKIKGLANYG